MKRHPFLIPLLFIGAALLSCAEAPETGKASPSANPPSPSSVPGNLRTLAETGDADAQNKLGVFYSEGLQNYAEAKRWFDKAAEQGHAGAQVNLGTLYFQGKGAPQSDQMALSWFRQAAQRQDPLAFAKLGLMYALGRGVQRDYVQAHMWYSLSVEHGEKRSAEFRDSLAKKMTPAQIAASQRLAASWTPKPR